VYCFFSIYLHTCIVYTLVDSWVVARVILLGSRSRSTTPSSISIKLLCMHVACSFVDRRIKIGNTYISVVSVGSRC
jgi:hypothetical protein